MNKSIRENINELFEQLRVTKPNSKSLRLALLDVCGIMQQLNDNEATNESTNDKVVKLSADEVSCALSIITHHIELLARISNYSSDKKIDVDNSLEKELLTLKVIREKLENA